MGGAKRYPSVVAQEAMGFARCSTHPTRFERLVGQWLEISQDRFGSKCDFASATERGRFQPGIRHTTSPKSDLTAMRGGRKISFSFNLIWVVQSPSAKIFSFPFDPNHFTVARIPAHTRGVSRSSRTLDRDAMDASGAADESADLADGEAVWS
jgi:hypothetical protein